MRRDSEPTLLKSMLVGALISLILLLAFVSPVQASKKDPTKDPYWYAEGYWDSATNWNYRTWGVRACQIREFS